MSKTLAVRTSAVRARGKRSLIEAWLDGKSKHTQRAYARDLDDFAAFSEKPSAAAVNDLLSMPSADAQAHVLDYRTHLEERELSGATVSRRLAALRSLVKLGRMLGLCNWEIEVASPTVETYRDTRGPGSDGWGRIREALEAIEPEDLRLRNTAILHLLHDLALRRSEVASIDLIHLEADLKKVWIQGKGRRARVRLSLPHPTRKAIAAWIVARGSHQGPLFHRLDPASTGRERLSDDAIYQLVSSLGYKAKLSRPLRPHGIRHLAITSALEKTRGDVRAVQRFSRHKHLETLMRYDDNRKDDAGAIAELVAGDDE